MVLALKVGEGSPLRPPVSSAPVLSCVASACRSTALRWRRRAARLTAAPVAATHDLPVGEDERIIEAASHFEGLSFGVGDGSLKHPRHWKYLRNPFRPSWGEPYEAIAARMLIATAEVRDRVRGREAVLVSHQSPIWLSRLKAEGKRLWHDPRKRQCSLASVTSFIYDDDRIVQIDSRSADPEAARRASEASIPLRRYGRPEEFGRVAAFCLSPAASYLTGVMLPVDGGMLHGL